MELLRAALFLLLATVAVAVAARHRFVGSDRSAARAAIAAALGRPAAVEVEIRPEGADAISYEVTGAPAGTVLHVAWVERIRVVPVRSGENARRTLRHGNVVRAFESVRLSGPRGTIALRPPSDGARDGASVVAYCQDPATAVILGAARIDLGV